MTTSGDAELLAFAEDPGAYVMMGPDEERIMTDRSCVMFSPGIHFWSTSVCRVRFGDDVGAALHEVRGLMVARDRTEAVWLIGPAATPTGLADLLLGLGLELESPDGSVILVLTRPPQVAPSLFDVRPVATLDEHLAAIEVGVEGFVDEDAADERRRARETFEAEREGGHVARLVAWDGDRPVATGHASVSPFGLYLGGGATLRSDRRRGAMSAMIGGAWEHAVAHGTPTLVTFGGAMSAPILERLGFRSVGRVQHVIDRLR